MFQCFTETNGWPGISAGFLCNICAHYRAPRKACANNEKLKSAWNEHKNESFYAYENLIEAVKYSAPSFLSFVQNLCNNSHQK